VEEKEREEYVASLARWNGKGMYQEVRGRAAWRDIESSYVITKNDMTVLIDYQTTMVEEVTKEGRNLRILELDTGHSPGLTMTEKLVEFIMDITERY